MGSAAKLAKRKMKENDIFVYAFCLTLAYSSYCGKEYASSSASDVHGYVIIRKFLGPIFNTRVSDIHPQMGKSDILSHDFSSIRLPTQVMTYLGS
jgi:hypothetical protein